MTSGEAKEAKGRSNTGEVGGTSPGVLQFDNIPSLNPAFETAKWLVERGLPVFPIYQIERGVCSCSNGRECQTPGKHPRTHNGVKDATTDLTTIASWAGRWPKANWAVTGALVVDVDPRHGGFDSVKNWETELVTPWTVTTGGAGRHYFFALPDGVGNRNGWLPGVDVKATGGYVVVAGSIHQSGARYEWTGGRPPTEPLPSAPQNLVESIAAGSAGGSTTFDVGDVLDGVPEGQRNDMLFRFACWLRRTFQDNRLFVEGNLRLANHGFDPPLADDEIQTILGSAFKQKHDDLAAEAARWTAFLRSSAGWDEPVKLESQDKLPPFPLDSLPTSLRVWVEAAAEAMQLPPDLPAAMGMATVMASFVGKVHVSVKEGWVEHPSLYVLGLHPPGSRKSALAKVAFKPMFDAQQEMQQQATVRIQAALSRQAALKVAVDAAKRKLSKSPGDPDALREFEEAQFRMTTHLVPSNPLLVVGDITPEALGIVMQEQGERIAILDSEGGGLITVLGARFGRDKNVSNLDLVLKSWSGDPVAVHRQGRDPVTMESPCLNIGTITQPAVLESLRNVPEATTRGMIERLSVFAPPDRMGARDADPDPIPPSVQADYEYLVSSLVREFWDQAGVALVPLSPEARGLVIQRQRDIEPRLARDGDLRDIAEFLNKVSGTAIRIALVLHVAEFGVDAVRARTPISWQTMQRAMHIGDYLTQHFRFVARTAGLSPVALMAERILRRIKTLPEFDRRSIYRGLGRPSGDPDVAAALVLLEEHGYIRSVDPGPRTPGKAGRPKSEVFAVNPHLSNEEN